MNKRQAKKIMFRNAIMVNQPKLYTVKQIRKAWRVTNPKKHMPPMLSVVDFDKPEYDVYNQN